MMSPQLILHKKDEAYTGFEWYDLRISSVNHNTDALFYFPSELPLFPQPLLTKVFKVFQIDQAVAA